MVKLAIQQVFRWWGGIFFLIGVITFGTEVSRVVLGALAMLIAADVAQGHINRPSALSDLKIHAATMSASVTLMFFMLIEGLEAIVLGMALGLLIAFPVISVKRAWNPYPDMPYSPHVKFLILAFFLALIVTIIAFVVSVARHLVFAGDLKFAFYISMIALILANVFDWAVPAIHAAKGKECREQSA